MKGELYINEKDAWVHWGVNMGDGFLEALLTPSPMKEYIENKSRLTDGKQMLYRNPRVDERDVQLTVTLEGDTQQQYLERYENFMRDISQGEIRLRLPVLGRTFKLYYKNAPTKMGNYGLKFGKFDLGFCEPDPTDRY